LPTKDTDPEVRGPGRRIEETARPGDGSAGQVLEGGHSSWTKLAREARRFVGWREVISGILCSLPPADLLLLVSTRSI